MAFNHFNRERSRRVAARVGIALFCLMGPPLLSYCAEEDRCKTAVDCEVGLICSNLLDQASDGVCVDKCDPRVAAQAPCFVDGGTDGSKDGSKDGDSEGGMTSMDGGKDQ
jgi:hypothetical protein